MSSRRGPTDLHVYYTLYCDTSKPNSALPWQNFLGVLDAYSGRGKH
jgi:hypothetical protein